MTAVNISVGLPRIRPDVGYVLYMLCSICAAHRLDVLLRDVLSRTLRCLGPSPTRFARRAGWQDSKGVARLRCFRRLLTICREDWPEWRCFVHSCGLQQHGLLLVLQYQRASVCIHSCRPLCLWCRLHFHTQQLQPSRSQQQTLDLRHMHTWYPSGSATANCSLALALLIYHTQTL